VGDRPHPHRPILRQGVDHHDLPVDGLGNGICSPLRELRLREDDPNTLPLGLLDDLRDSGRPGLCVPPFDGDLESNRGQTLRYLQNIYLYNSLLRCIYDAELRLPRGMWSTAGDETFRGPPPCMR
jgi:hypothetical protein